MITIAPAGEPSPRLILVALRLVPDNFFRVECGIVKVSRSRIAELERTLQLEPLPVPARAHNTEAIYLVTGRAA